MSTKKHSIFENFKKAEYQSNKNPNHHNSLKINR